MAVPEGERAKPKLHFLLTAQELAVYTLKITRNKKVFKDEYFDCVTAPIIEAAQSVFYDAFEANNVYVTTAGDWITRRELQRRAIRKCNRMLPQIQLAQKVFHFKTKRLKFWGEKIIKTRDALKAWHEADRKRYSKIT